MVRFTRFHFSPRIFGTCFALVAFQLATSAADFAWQDTGKYRPPDFEGTFSHEPEFGKRLEEVFKEMRGQVPAPENIFELFRRGLRTCSLYPQTTLGWFGPQYIWNKSPQNAEAIELMYHAVGSTNREISYNALYFGLSTVRPMTEPILRTLVDLGMKSEDPNILSRIAWGGAAQKGRLVHYLKPYLESEDSKQREHAQTLQKIFSGELKAFVWASEQARKRAEAKYSNRLEEIRTTLTKGDSRGRRETLDLILGERIALIMDESFIPAFAAAATDAEPKVRELVAKIAGDRWIWSATDQPPEAIELMMQLSRDPNRHVRYDANYYGLSTIRHRTDEEVERMIEMALYDGLDNPDFRGRVTWGLERNRELVGASCGNGWPPAKQIRSKRPTLTAFTLVSSRKIRKSLRKWRRS